jgi:hypothetical protein
MAKKTKKRGRPKTTGAGVSVQVRMQPDFLAMLDAWRAAQPGGLTRPQAIRWLTEMSLRAAAKVVP